MKYYSTYLALALAGLAPQALAAPTQTTIANTFIDVTANYCRLNVHYCGWNLIKRDSGYKDRIHHALCRRGLCDANDPAIWNSLWNCGADLEFLAICGGENSCHDGGAGHSDYCK
ncbi:hypothetical protein GJ744_009591 [Endocarpon pusillum]|uniref:Extracellular membrane protein CFEM domain-containing protein n=1 Tax=Endocarpon pusillum TaxID=364733 RepID=A0A8H7E4D6_9EURO|nr:hypothetical protein GJ744_009591 [Endocarpon pusillum]